MCVRAFLAWRGSLFPSNTSTHVRSKPFRKTFQQVAAFNASRKLLEGERWRIREMMVSSKGLTEKFGPEEFEMILRMFLFFTI